MDGLGDVSYKDLAAELRRRDVIAEKARQDKRYHEYKERQARYEAEDRGFRASIGITYDQYVEAWIHYENMSELRY